MTKLNNFLQTNVAGVNNYQHNDTLVSNKPIAKTSQGFFVPSEKPSKEYS